MAKSLQDQLRGAGLASAHEVRKARSEKRTKARRGETDAAAAGARAAAAEAAAVKAAKDRELNRSQELAREERQRVAQRAQLISAHRVTWKPGETPYRFSDGARVASLYLDDETRAGVVAGRLAIAKAGAAGSEEYVVIATKGALRLRESHPDALVVDHAPLPGDAPGKQDGASDDDPYAGYEVPDDLVW